MSDQNELERLEEELDLPRVLVLQEDDAGDISIDCPGVELSDNDRIALLLKSLLCELGPTLVGVLEAVELDDDEGEDA